MGTICIIKQRFFSVQTKDFVRQRHYWDIKQIWFNHHHYHKKMQETKKIRTRRRGRRQGITLAWEGNSYSIILRQRTRQLCSLYRQLKCQALLLVGGEVSSGACGKSCIYLTIVHSRRLQAFKSREESSRPPCFFRAAVLPFYFLNCILLIKHAM